MRDNRRVTNDHAAIDMIVGERRRGGSKMLRATWLIGFLLVVALGWSTAYAFAINDAGQVVGAAATAEGESHAFLWEAGQMTILDDLGGPESADTAINSTGQIAGIALTSEEDVHAVRWDEGRLRQLHSSSDAWSWARAINDAGHVGGGV